MKWVSKRCDTITKCNTYTYIERDIHTHTHTHTHTYIYTLDYQNAKKKVRFKKISKSITAENFPKLRKDIKTQIQVSKKPRENKSEKYQAN